MKCSILYRTACAVHVNDPLPSISPSATKKLWRRCTLEVLYFTGMPVPTVFCISDGLLDPWKHQQHINLSHAQRYMDFHYWDLFLTRAKNPTRFCSNKQEQKILHNGKLIFSVHYPKFHSIYWADLQWSSCATEPTVMFAARWFNEEHLLRT